MFTEIKLYIASMDLVSDRYNDKQKLYCKKINVFFIKVSALKSKWNISLRSYAKRCKNLVLYYVRHLYISHFILIIKYLGMQCKNMNRFCIKHFYITIDRRVINNILYNKASCMFIMVIDFIFHILCCILHNFYTLTMFANVTTTCYSTILSNITI